MPDNYIDECVSAGHCVTIYTVNGYQIKGKILHDSEDSIVIFSNGKKKLIYKHAISTIEPA